jgi:enamine deaminase RidA (YjgF/YER057c/UK114 family)
MTVAYSISQKGQATMDLQAILPEGWQRPSGYSHAIAGRGGLDLCVAGQFGWDPETRKCVTGDFVAQWEQALANVVAVVRTAGGTPNDLLSLRIYVLDIEHYRRADPKKLGNAWIRQIGKWFPAVTMVEVRALEDAEALIEIEAAAKIAP